MKKKVRVMANKRLKDKAKIPEVSFLFVYTEDSECISVLHGR